MSVSVLLFGAAVVVLTTGTVHAQDVPGTQGPAQPTAVEASRLPVNFTRLQRSLLRSTTREVRDGLNLRYEVTVFGQAPRIVLFTKQDNLKLGPAPYGAPTHRDLMRVMTPREFRSPP